MKEMYEGWSEKNMEAIGVIMTVSQAVCKDYLNKGDTTTAKTISDAVLQIHDALDDYATLESGYKGQSKHKESGEEICHKN